MRFGDKLKNIFDALGLSYADVSRETGLDEGQLYNVVNHKLSPTVEALDILSYLVGQDLYGLYTKSLSDGDIFDFIENIDEKNVNLDMDNEYELKVIEKKIELMEKDGENPAKIKYTTKEYHRLYAKNQMYKHHAYTEAIDYISYYLSYQYKIDILKDELQQIHPVDARIILLLVEAFIAIGEHMIGLDVLKRLSNCQSISEIMEIKCAHLIAEIYESLGMHREAYHFAELGIDLSIKYNNNTMLPDLFLWKALAEISLGMSNARASIDSMLRYTRILRSDANVESYVKIFKDKYGIDIMRPGGFQAGARVKI